MKPIITVITTPSTRNQLVRVVDEIKKSMDCFVEFYNLSQDGLARDFRTRIFLKVASVDENRFIVITTPEITRLHRSIVEKQRSYVIEEVYSNDTHESLSGTQCSYVVTDKGKYDELLTAVPPPEVIEYSKFGKLLYITIKNDIDTDRLIQYPLSIIYACHQHGKTEEEILESFDNLSNLIEWKPVMNATNRNLEFSDTTYMNLHIKATVLDPESYKPQQYSVQKEI